MTILDELLKEIKDTDLDIRLKKLCDMIQNEESGENYDGPMGSNTFISVLANVIPKNKEKFNEYYYVTLEREEVETYIVRHWKRIGDGPFKVIRNINLPKYDKPQKILHEFAKKYKFLKGD